MIDHRGKLSSSLDFDDERYWRFSRTSGLPRGYFNRPRISPDGIVVIVCCILGIAMLGVLIAERMG